MEILGIVASFILIWLAFEPERVGVWLRRVKNGFNAPSSANAEQLRKAAKQDVKAARRRRSGKGLSQKGWGG